jgi:hypothetical protein
MLAALFQVLAFVSVSGAREKRYTLLFSVSRALPFAFQRLYVFFFM